MAAGKNKNDGYIIEYITLGGSMKVTAFDPNTLLEASIIAPMATPHQDAAELAVRKLLYRIEREKDNP